MSNTLNVSFLQQNGGYQELDQDILGMAASDGDGETLSEEEARGYVDTRTELAKTANYEGGDYAGAWLYQTLKKYLAARAYTIAAASEVDENIIIDHLKFGADNTIVDADVKAVAGSMSKDAVIGSMARYIASTNNFNLAKAALSNSSATVVEAAQSAVARLSPASSKNAEALVKELTKPTEDLTRASLTRVFGKTADNNALDALLKLANDSGATSAEKDAAAETMFDIFNADPQKTLEFIVEAAISTQSTNAVIAMQFVFDWALQRARNDVEWKAGVWTKFVNNVLDSFEAALKDTNVTVETKSAVAKGLGSIPTVRSYKILTDVFSKETDDKVVIASAAAMLRQYRNIEELEVDGAQSLDIEKELVQLLKEKVKEKRWEYYGFENVAAEDLDSPGGTDQLGGKYSEIDRLIMSFVIAGIGGRGSVEALKEVFGIDYDEMFLKEIAKEIGGKGDERDTQEVYSKAVQPGNSMSVDREFAKAVGNFGVKSAMSVLEKILNEKPDIHEDVIKAFDKIGGAATGKLVELLESPDTNFVEKAAAIYDLAQSGTRAAIPALSNVARYSESPINKTSEATFRNISAFVPVEDVSLDTFKDGLRLKEFEAVVLIEGLLARLQKPDTEEGKAAEVFLREALASEETGDAVISLMQDFMTSETGNWEKTRTYVKSLRSKYQELQDHLSKTAWDPKNFQKFMEQEGLNTAEVMGAYTLSKTDNLEKDVGSLSPLDVINLSSDDWQGTELWKYMMSHQWEKKEAAEVISNVVWFLDEEQRAAEDEEAMSEKAGECDEIREAADKCGKTAAFVLNPRNGPISSELTSQIMSEAGAWKCIAPAAGECQDADGNFVEGMNGAFTCLKTGVQTCARIECGGDVGETKGEDAEICVGELTTLTDELLAQRYEASVDVRLERYAQIEEFLDEVETARNDAINPDTLNQYAASRMEDMDYLASEVENRTWHQFEIEDHLTRESDWTDEQLAGLRKADPLNELDGYGRKLAAIFGTSVVKRGQETTPENYEDQRIAEADAFEQFSDTLKKSEWTEKECLDVHTVLAYLKELYGRGGANFRLEDIVSRSAEGENADALSSFYDGAKEAMTFDISEEGLFFKRVQQALDRGIKFPNREGVWSSLFNLLRSEDGREDLNSTFKTLAEDESATSLYDSVIKTLEAYGKVDAEFEPDDVAKALLQHIENKTVESLSYEPRVFAGLQANEISDAKKFLATLAEPAITTIETGYRILDILKNGLRSADYRFAGTTSDLSKYVEAGSVARFGAILQDPEAPLEDRMVSAVALGFVDGEESIKYLRRAVEEGTDNEVVFAAAASLGNLQSPAAFAQLWRDYNSDNEIARIAAAMGLARKTLTSDLLTASQELKAQEASAWFQSEMSSNMWATAAASYIVTDQNFNVLKSLAEGKVRPDMVKESAQIALEPVRRGMLEKELAPYPYYRVPIVVIKSKYTSTKDSAEAAKTVKSLYVNSTGYQKVYLLDEIVDIMDDKRLETEAARAIFADFFAKNSSTFALGSKEMKIIAKAVTCDSTLVNQMAVSGAFGSNGVSSSLKRELIEAIRLTGRNAPETLTMIATNSSIEENVRAVATEGLGKLAAVGKLIKIAEDTNNSYGVREHAMDVLGKRSEASIAEALVTIASRDTEKDDIRLHALNTISTCPCKTPAIIAGLEDIVNGKCIKCSVEVIETAQKILDSMQQKVACS